MENTTSIGRIASPSSQVVVERGGEQFTLKQGDSIFSGDVLQNKDMIAVDIELPARASGQADSLITLAPDSAARVDTIVGADGVSQQIEVSALTDGVELYALGDGENGAILLAEAGGEFQGLVGAGLLAGGGVSSTAMAVGGGLGLAALGSSDGGSASASVETDVAFDDNQDTGNPDDQPDDQDPPADNEDPPADNEDPPAEEDNGSGGGAAGGLDSLSGGLESTGDQLADGQLSPITDAASFVISGDTDSTTTPAAADPTGGQISGAGFNGLTDILTTAATEIGNGGEGTPLEPLTGFVATAVTDDTPSDRPDGLAGTLSAVSQGIYTGAQGSDAEQIANPVTALTGYDGDGHADGIAESLTYIANTFDQDSGPFEPLLAPLAPTIGTGEGDYDSSGLAGTTQEIAEGVYDLGTTEGSAFEPASMITDGLAFLVGGEEVASDPSGLAPEELSGGLAGGMEQVGQAIIDNNPFAEQDMGTGDFIGSLLGGDTQAPISSTSPSLPGDLGTIPTDF